MASNALNAPVGPSYVKCASAVPKNRTGEKEEVERVRKHYTFVVWGSEKKHDK